MVCPRFALRVLVVQMMDVNEMSAHEVEDTLKCLQVLPSMEPKQTAGASSGGVGASLEMQAVPAGARQLASMTLRQKRHAALMALARLASTRERHMEQSVLAAEASLDVLLTHFMAVRDAPGTPATQQAPGALPGASAAQRFALGMEGQLPSLERLARQLLPILERVLSLREVLCPHSFFSDFVGRHFPQQHSGPHDKPSPPSSPCLPPILCPSLTEGCTPACGSICSFCL